MNDVHDEAYLHRWISINELWRLSLGACSRERESLFDRTTQPSCSWALLSARALHCPCWLNTLRKMRW
jgi:hypothetical protein